MKRLFAIFLCLYMLINTIGYNVYAHFCGEDLKETSLIVETGSCCSDDEGNAEKSIDMNCCKEEVKQVIIKDDYIKATSEKVNAPAPIDLFFYFSDPKIFSVENSVATVASTYYNDTSPPGEHIPIHILHQVFRI